MALANFIKADTYMIIRDIMFDKHIPLIRMHILVYEDDTKEVIFMDYGITLEGENCSAFTVVNQDIENENILKIGYTNLKARSEYSGVSDC